MKQLFKVYFNETCESSLLDDLMYLPKTYELNNPYKEELLYDFEKIKNTYRKHDVDYLKNERWIQKKLIFY